MAKRKHMLTLKDLLIEFRFQFIQAIKEKDAHEVSIYGRIFATIEELAQEKGDIVIYKLAMDFHDASVDYMHGVEWKSTIPTVEDIKKAFDE